jgi:membrane protease YdiL (CAAX protease family)
MHSTKLRRLARRLKLRHRRWYFMWLWSLLFLAIIGVTTLLDGGSRLVLMVALVTGNFAFLPAIYVVGLHEAKRARWPGIPGYLFNRGGSRERLILVALFVIPVVVSFALFHFNQAQPGVGTKAIMHHPTVPLAFFMLFAVVSAPFVEEAVFRHYLLPWIRNRLVSLSLSAPTAAGFSIGLTALIFAAGHLGNMTPLWPKMVQILILGLCAAMARIRYGTRWAVAVHLFLNTILMIFSSYLIKDIV